MKLAIRTETPSDFASVYKINKQAFGQDAEAKLVELLRQSDAFIPSLSLVASLDGKLVAHLLFTKLRIVSKQGHSTESLALAPVAVLPEFQRQGIGKQLISYGLNKARDLQYLSVLVLGHEHYYPQFGFRPAATWHIESPFDVFSSCFMALELQAGSLNAAAGMVQYPKAFESV